MDKNKVDFDYFAENYNNTIIKASKFISKSNFDYFAYYKIKRLKSVINFKPLKILDYGCGIGNLIPEIKKIFLIVKSTDMKYLRKVWKLHYLVFHI